MLFRSGRYPVSVYPAWVQIIVTYLVPIAVATTVPLQALRGDLSLGRVLIFLAVSVVAAWAASLVWKAGIQRYSGASS